MNDNYGVGMRSNTDPHGGYRAQAAQHFGAQVPGIAEHRNITLLPDEEPVFASDFTSSPILRHIKSGLVVTNDRVVVRHPQYVFFFIKTGYAESSTPIRQVCEVTTGRLLSRRRLRMALLFGFAGVFVLMSGASAMGGIFSAFAVLIALVCLAIAAFQAWMARSLGLTVSHAGGGALHVDVDKLEFPDMVTAGRVIQQLVLGAGPPVASIAVDPRVRVEAPASASPYRAPEVATPAAQPWPARAEPVAQSAPAPRPTSPPSIWRG